eukprot:SAG22_NODE_3739_length_1551_cov_1.185262_3_plen_50_part_00
MAAARLTMPPPLRRSVDIEIDQDHNWGAALCVGAAQLSVVVLLQVFLLT